MGQFKNRIGDSKVAARLIYDIEGSVLFDSFSRGQYSTDASIYQIEPIGIVIPKSVSDIFAIMNIAKDEGLPILPRGAGTSQCGQTVGEALVIDTTKHLNRILEFSPKDRTIWVEPGVVLDDLNAKLKPYGLWFPVDVSTSSRATIGGMTGNNSCGSRSIRYGTMRDNVRSIDVILADGRSMVFGNISDNDSFDALSQQVRRLLAIGREKKEIIWEKFPNLMRRVGGYNVDALLPGGPIKGKWNESVAFSPNLTPNLAHLFVGSEGTLGFSTRIQLDLQPIPNQKVLGICHFPTFYKAMESTKQIVELCPTAVELIDKNMINLAREIPLFKETVNRFVKGDPEALLLVEFSNGDNNDQLKKLKMLDELMDDMGLPGNLVKAIDLKFQKAIWDVRKSGLNIMMSMKGDGKPISFIEDCAVRLEDLADYTKRLTEVFRKNNTRGTWYAHASVGCLHVRPIINLKHDVGRIQMRKIAESAFELVREYKGSHSGEHGDGLVRSEFHEAMFGSQMTNLFKEVKLILDPEKRMNPGKIVDPPKMDDPSLFRFKPDYKPLPIETKLDWSQWGGFSGAVEMCNNNGACRKSNRDVMCPSYRVTRNEQDLTRGRANSLRLAISGQLGKEAFTSKEMFETMKLCVGCKGCKRECPTGVDMARMKTEFLYHYKKRHGLSLFDWIISYLPRYAPFVSRFSWMLNARNKFSGLRYIFERLVGISAKRELPNWDSNPFSRKRTKQSSSKFKGPEVVLFADTFNTYFEPENLRSADKVLSAAGYNVIIAQSNDTKRPLCCGRTFLASGLLEEAKEEASRSIDALFPFAKRGVPIIGLEPSCLYTLRDEFLALIPGPKTEAIALRAVLLEEFLVSQLDKGNLKLKLNSIVEKKAFLHGHCHQKAFSSIGATEKILNLIPELNVSTIESSCCGMAGSFGYEVANQKVSIAMGELELFPAIRKAPKDALIVADGTSCRHQIHDGVNRKAFHIAKVLEQALEN